MKNFVNYYFPFFLFIMAGCQVVGGIFKAGMAWGILLVVGLVALIIFFISKSGKK